MLFPTVTTRVKQKCGITCVRVCCRDICAFVQIAAQAAQGKVAFFCFATVRECDNMLDVKSNIARILTHAAVLAAAVGTLNHYVT